MPAQGEALGIWLCDFADVRAPLQGFYRKLACTQGVALGWYEPLRWGFGKNLRLLYTQMCQWITVWTPGGDGRTHPGERHGEIGQLGNLPWNRFVRMDVCRGHQAQHARIGIHAPTIYPIPAAACLYPKQLDKIMAVLTRSGEW